MRTKDPRRISHHVAELLLVARVHHRHRFRSSIRRIVVWEITAAKHDDVAANARAGFLNHGTADRRNVSFDGAFDNDIAAERHRALFDCAGDPEGLSYAEDGAFVGPFNHYGLVVAGAL